MLYVEMVRIVRRRDAEDVVPYGMDGASVRVCAGVCAICAVCAVCAVCAICAAHRQIP